MSVWLTIDLELRNVWTIGYKSVVLSETMLTDLIFCLGLNGEAIWVNDLSETPSDGLQIKAPTRVFLSVFRAERASCASGTDLKLVVFEGVFSVVDGLRWLESRRGVSFAGVLGFGRPISRKEAEVRVGVDLMELVVESAM